MWLSNWDFVLILWFVIHVFIVWYKLVYQCLQSCHCVVTIGLESIGGQVFVYIKNSEDRCDITHKFYVCEGLWVWASKSTAKNKCSMCYGNLLTTHIIIKVTNGFEITLCLANRPAFSTFFNVLDCAPSVASFRFSNLCTQCLRSAFSKHHINYANKQCWHWS